LSDSKIVNDTEASRGVFVTAKLLLYFSGNLPTSSHSCTLLLPVLQVVIFKSAKVAY